MQSNHRTQQATNNNIYNKQHGFLNELLFPNEAQPVVLLHNQLCLESCTVMLTLECVESKAVSPTALPSYSMHACAVSIRMGRSHQHCDGLAIHHGNRTEATKLPRTASAHWMLHGSSTNPNCSGDRTMLKLTVLRRLGNCGSQTGVVVSNPTKQMLEHDSRYTISVLTLPILPPVVA